MVHLRPGRLNFRIRLASRRDEAFLDESELPPLRKPKPGRPARIITRAEEIASNAAWARARLHEKLRGAVGWTEATGIGLYGALLMLLLGRHMPDAPAEGLPLHDGAAPLPMARGGSDPALQVAGAGPAADAGAEAPGAAAAGGEASVLARTPHGTGLPMSAAATPLAPEHMAAAEPVLPTSLSPAMVIETGARMLAALLQGTVLPGTAQAEVLPAGFRGQAGSAEAAAAAAATVRTEASKAAALGTKAAQAEAAAKAVQPAEADTVPDGPGASGKTAPGGRPGDGQVGRGDRCGGAAGERDRAEARGGGGCRPGAEGDRAGREPYRGSGRRSGVGIAGRRRRPGLAGLGRAGGCAPGVG